MPSPGSTSTATSELGEYTALRLRVIIGATLGIAACVFVFTRHDWDEIWRAVELFGWGLAVIILWRFASLVIAGAAWRLLYAAP